MGEFRPRLLWLNGPHYVGKRTLARTLRDEWEVPLLDAEAIGFTLQEGMPAALDRGDLHEMPLWAWCMWRIGIEMAHTYRIVTMPSAVLRSGHVKELVAEFQRRGVDVLHVVISASDPELRKRIHAHDVDIDAKRWALEHRNHAVHALSGLDGTLYLDSTGRSPRQLAGDLTRALVSHGWLTADLAWTDGRRVDT